MNESDAKPPSQVCTREQLRAQSPVPWGTSIRDLGDGVYVMNATPNENAIIDHMNERIRALEVAREGEPLLATTAGA